MKTLFDEENVAEVDAAILSDDLVYRYTLSRAWAPGPLVVVAGHNPSRADAMVDDHTVRRLRQLVAAAQYSGFIIVNPCAFRATCPQVLVGVADPIGPENNDYIRSAIQFQRAPAVILAWGGKSPIEAVMEKQRALILQIAKEAGTPVLCWGRTKDGAPRHPSRLPRTAKLEPFT